eukprot:5936400-Prymnesium_polylepis.1
MGTAGGRQERGGGARAAQKQGRGSPTRKGRPGCRPEKQLLVSGKVSPIFGLGRAYCASPPSVSSSPSSTSPHASPSSASRSVSLQVGGGATVPPLYDTR